MTTKIETKEFKISEDCLKTAYHEAVSGAVRIVKLGLIAECAFIERVGGGITFSRWVENMGVCSLGTINNARRCVKKIIGDSPTVWSTILGSLPDPSQLMSIDNGRLPPRLADIQKKLLDACEGKTTQQLEYHTGIRKEKQNGHASNDELEEIARKRNPNPKTQLDGDPVKRTEKLLFGGRAETQQRTSLTGKIFELLETDTTTIKEATTPLQRQNIAARLEKLAKKIKSL